MSENITPDEVNAILSEPKLEYDLEDFTPEEKALAAKLIPIIAAKANDVARINAEAAKAREVEKYVQELSAENSKMIEGELKRIREANKPPSLPEMQKLLSQEYLEMTVTLRQRNDNGNPRQREFVLGELPQATETKLIKALTDSITPKLRELSAIDFSGMNTEHRIKHIVGLLPDAMDLMAEMCALCLDPYGDEKIDKDWVKMNMSSARIRDVLEAQVAVGRIRDFFSQASRLIPEFLTR